MLNVRQVGLYACESPVSDRRFLHALPVVQKLGVGRVYDWAAQLS